MNTDACSQISYAAQQDAETYFSKRAAFEETLDLSAYGGEDGGEIKISYEYENKSSLELFTPPALSGGTVGILWGGGGKYRAYGNHRDGHEDPDHRWMGLSGR